MPLSRRRAHCRGFTEVATSPHPASKRSVSYVGTWQPCISRRVERTARAEHGAHASPTLSRRRWPARHHRETLHIGYRKDVPFECRYTNEFVALADASRLELHDQCKKGLLDEDAGEWSLELPPATIELELGLYWYAVRPPRVRGPGVTSLRWLALDGLTVLRPSDFLSTVVFPSLEELHIVDCTLPASIDITSDTMPRLKRLRITDVTVMSATTKAGIAVLADELREIRVSCRCPTEPMESSNPAAYHLLPRFRALFTRYSCFCVRAPKLRVFE